MPTIHFESKLVKIGQWTILRLPKDASAKLPSRGMVMVEGTINGVRFKEALEPDGKGSHWFKVDKTLGQAGDTVSLEIESSKQWPEPNVPTDLKKALTDAPKVKVLWKDITPMARWDWIRWIGSTKNPQTREKRIKVTFSKLSAGTRRPCCFNRSMCCDPSVSHNGVLL